MSIATTRLDLKGLKCPLPVLHTRKALRRLGAGDLLIVECTDPLASIDIPHLAREMGGAVELLSESNGVYLFQIRAM
jgi:tRNA 2-thiouridine synthesizing protein A